MAHPAEWLMGRARFRVRLTVGFLAIFPGCGSRLKVSKQTLQSQAILVAPGQCTRERIDSTIGTYEDWLRRGEPLNR